MTYQTVQPIDKLARVSAVTRYAENRKQHDKGGGRKKEKPPSQQQHEEATGDKFYASAKEHPKEFGALLRKLVEENGHMKETSKTTIRPVGGIELATGAWMLGITVPALTKK